MTRRGRLAVAVVCVLACGLWARALHAQLPAGPPLRLTLSPAQPVQGTIFLVEVSPAEAAPARLDGRFAGEPVRFHPRADGSAWAVAAAPVDAPGALVLELDATWPDGRTERVEQTVTIARGRYAMERLTVAPEYGAPPAPELARRIEAEAARAQAVGRGAHDTPPLWSPGEFVRPRATRVTSGFGNGREFNGRVESRHTGTDFQGAVGEPVLAAACGVVRLVDRFYLGGNVVYIDHGGGLSTGYLHLSETRVAVGDTVAAGERIGSVGATGRVTGPHLHWVLRFGAITVNPLSALELRPP